MATKNLRDFIKEAKAVEPYRLDLGDGSEPVTFADPSEFLVEDQFELAETSDPKLALQMFLGADFDRAWEVFRSLKLRELNEITNDARDHFRAEHKAAAKPAPTA